MAYMVYLECCIMGALRDSPAPITPRTTTLFQPWNWYRENYSIVQSQTRNIKQLH